MHQVNVYEVKTGGVLKEQVVSGKESERGHIQVFWQPVWVKGRVVSADALHTHASTCDQITASGGNYLLFAKGNQPTLQEDLHAFFEEPPLECRDWREATSVTGGRGRVEQRWIRVSTELNDFLAQEWPGVAQVFCLRRRVFRSLYCTPQVVYAITSLSTSQADPRQLLKIIQDHWTIENRLHYRRDVTLREDASQVRKGCAPQTLAVLNSFLLALLD